MHTTVLNLYLFQKSTALFSNIQTVNTELLGIHQ